MKKVSKIFEIGYFVIAIVFLYEAYINWSIDQSQSYLYLLFSAMAIFMYFFRRRFRKKMENNNK
jgi:TATA-binding protein-associated factor Taf7